MKLPPWPHFDDDEMATTARVLNSGKVNYWTGEEGRHFEREFATYCGVDHAIALTNGTAALEVALHALGLGPGDDVIVPSCTFIATASAAVMRGANPVVADIDPESLNLTVNTIDAALTPRTRAIIVVHLAGWPCDLAPIIAYARQRGIYLIEDCAQAHGATYRGQPVGSFGDVGAFSFCQDKIMSTGGEGGMIVTNNPTVWDRAWSFKDHGKSYDAVYNRNHPPGFRWLHESFGTNLRLTEMQSAIGRIQLTKLDGWVAKRRENAATFTAKLQSHPALHVPTPPDDCAHAYYKFYVYIDLEQLRTDWDRQRLLSALAERGVPCFTGICTEIHREIAFAAPGLNVSDCPTAKAVGEQTLLFLVHPTLDATHISWMADEFLDVLDNAIEQ